MVRVLKWNGRDIPEELRSLPAGQYVVEPFGGDDQPLTADEEAGIETALEAYRQGRVVDHEAAKARIEAILKR